MESITVLLYEHSFIASRNAFTYLSILTGDTSYPLPRFNYWQRSPAKPMSQLHYKYHKPRKVLWPGKNRVPS